MSGGNGAFKSMPTFEMLARRLDELETCVTAQGEIINFLLGEVQEREFEITFLMNISSVVIPTSKIADANGKVPAIRKSAKQIYEEEGRTKIVAAFEARQKSERDAIEQGLPQADRAPEEPPQPNGEARDTTPLDFRIPGKTTH